MRQGMLVWCFLAVCIMCHSETVEIRDIVAQSVLEDPNPFRYDPLNVLSQGSATTFAFHRTSVDIAKPILTVFFGKATVLSAVSVEPGYFDPKWFSKNDRVTKMRIVAKDQTQTAIAEVTASFRDTMVPQLVKFDKETTCTEIDLYAQDVTRGTTSDDVCISNLTFYHGAAKLTPFIEPEEGAMGRSRSIQYAYDAKSRLVQKQSDFGLSGYETESFTYNPDGVTCFSLDRQFLQGFGGKPNSKSDKYICFFYEDNDPKLLTKTVTLGTGGQIAQSEEYRYDSQERVTVITKSGLQSGIVSYTYDKDELIAKDEDYN